MKNDDLQFTLVSMKNLKIPLSEADETFLSLWIFINKKDLDIAIRSPEPADLSTAEIFYKVNISGKSQFMNNSYIS